MNSEDLSKLRLDKSSAGFQRRRRVPRRALLGIAAVVIIAVVALVAANPAVEVETAVVAKVYPSQSFTLLNASGYVVAQRKAAVASKATGRLEWLGVEEGSKVRSGEVIARLENRDVMAATDQAAAGLNSAQADLADAQQNYDRMKDLRAKGYIAQAELDSADTRLKRTHAALTGAEAALRAAQVAVEYTLIRAPFDAVVLTKDADIGDIVTPLGAAANARASVVTIADMSSLQVEVDVAESNIEKVKPGQPCEIQLDALPDSRFPGIVHMTVPTADRTKASVMVKVRFASRDPRVLPEMSARVAFLERPMTPDEQTPRTAINPAAVLEENGRKLVYVVRDDRSVKTAVTLGERLGDFIEVLGGLTPGEKVVLAPSRKLRDGSKVKRKEL
jgi:RND family efflux transporter MFP subunit